MAVVNKMELGRELGQTLVQVNRSIQEVKDLAKEAGVDPFSMRDKQGNWTMAQLLVAKSNCLLGLAIANQKDR